MTETTVDTVETTDAFTLTAEDVKALRTAEEVTFHHYKGESCIRLYLRGTVSEEVRVFTASQQRLFPETRDVGAHERARVIACDAAVSAYDDGRSWWPRELSDVTCFSMGAATKGTWRTVIDLLRVGDRLTLRWLAGNNNQYLTDAGLNLDELDLVVCRDGKHSERRLAFNLANSTCPDNTARMIRRHSRKPS